MVYKQILDWSNEQEVWAQDALRRVALSAQHNLPDKEIIEILNRLKSSYDLGGGEKPACMPLAADQLKKQGATNERRLLCSIEEVKNVNRLATGQRLKFALNGITLIYGENGTGKSGYSRILKKLCRALIVDELLGNVFSGAMPKPAEVQLKHKLPDDKDTTSEKWVDGTKPPSAVANIAVFDSKAARLYVDQENQIQYLPPEISLMEGYSDILKKLAEKISAEVIVIDKRVAVALPTGFTEGSVISKLIQPLVAASTYVRGKRARGGAPLPIPAKLTAAANWNDTLEEERKKLEESLRNDPAIQAAKCQRMASVFTTLSVEVSSLTGSLSDEKASLLQKKAQEIKISKETAEKSASELFPKDKFLAQTGSEPWKRMYEYAKEFVQHATGAPSESVSIRDICALCQQPLTPEAKERLKAFEGFISDKANKAYADAKIALEALKKEIAELKIPAKTELEQRLAEYGAISESHKKTADEVAAFFEAARKRRASLTAAMEKTDFSKIEVISSSPKPKLDDLAKALADEAVEMAKKAQKGGGRDAERQRLIDLQDQKLLSQSLPTFTARLSDLILLEKLDKCAAALGTGSVSGLIGKLRRKLVTDDLQTRITAEIKDLDLGHIPFVVKDKGAAGKSYVGVKLKSVSEVENREVLSEGEQRALALACFLGEVLGDEVKHGVIIDDPVSSLDHIRIRRVAKRLAREAAAGRQVIIFTHNLLFFSEVIAAAAENGPQVPVLTHYISKDETRGFGIVNENDVPWVAKKVAQRIDILRRQRLPVLKGRTDTGSDEYRRAVKDFYTELRETWERFVEEILLAGVVERFGSDVKTQSLKGVVVKNEDYQKVYFAMKRVSERSGHDAATAKMMHMPSFEDMQTDLDELDTFRLAIEKRSKALQSERKELEKPPTAETA